MALELVDITEDELEDILFMRAPRRVPTTRLRLKLELDIKRIWDEDIAEIRRDFPSWEPSPDDRPVISPAMLYRAFFQKAWDELSEMTLHELADAVSAKMGEKYAASVRENDYRKVFGCDRKIKYL